MANQKDWIRIILQAFVVGAVCAYLGPFLWWGLLVVSAQHQDYQQVMATVRNPFKIAGLFFAILVLGRGMITK